MHYRKRMAGQELRNEASASAAPMGGGVEGHYRNRGFTQQGGNWKDEGGRMKDERRQSIKARKEMSSDDAREKPGPARGRILRPLGGGLAAGLLGGGALGAEGQADPAVVDDELLHGKLR